MNDENRYDEPAFPIPLQAHADGMTLRDYFAAKAMQGVLANERSWEMPSEMVAKCSYELADAMLKEGKQAK